MTPPRTLLDRLAAAYPLVLAYVVLLVLYAWQTSRVTSPWVFTDELNWSMLSRAIAHTGHPALRGHEVSSASLYAYLLAPAWWLDGSGPGYAAAKYINAAVMTATIFPAYALARLFVSRLPSFVTAVATATIPTYVYLGALIPESLAYFWATLAFWLLARALLRPGPVAVALATIVVVMAPWVRPQLQVLIPAAVIAAAIVVATSRRGVATIGSWTWGERLGAVILVVGVLIAVDVALAQRSNEWYVGTHFWHRALTYGLWAVGALAIGNGVLPLLLALAWLLGWPRESREERVLLGVLVGSAVGFCAYTAVKASFLSTSFSIRVEERNLIYLCPLVFVAAARFVTAARARAVPVALAAAAVGYLLQTTPYHAYERFYSDAPGLSVLQWLNRKWYWTNTDLKWLLFAILAGGVVALAAREAARRSARGTAAVGVAAVVIGGLVVAWNLTGEVAAANSARSSAHFYRSLLPTPPDWIDATTRRGRTMFIGAALQNSYTFWTLEFWNQSIQDVWSVDASAPPPGPATTPNFRDTAGALQPQLPVEWVAAQPPILVRGRLAEHAGGIDVYRVRYPIRLVSFVSGATADGWTEAGVPSRYVRFAPRRQPGTLRITLSRTAACGDVPPARVTFRISDLRIDEDAQPVAGARQKIVHAAVRSNPCEETTVAVRAVAPLRVDTTARGTVPSGDGRPLAAQIGYSFTPDRA